MPPLQLESPNQIAATAGRSPRLALAAGLRELAPLAVANREFAQRERQLELEAQAQEAAQQQQTVGTAISGVGTLATAGLAAKQLGLLGGTTAATTAGAAAPTLAAAGGSAAITGGAPLAAAGAAEGAAAFGAGAAGTTAATTGAATGGAAASGAFSGALAAAAPVVVAAAPGLIFGSLAGPAIRRAVGGGAKGRAVGGLASAAIGAGAGLIIGGPVGAIAGGLVGGLSGSLCVIHEASYGTDSYEVCIARRFRDTRLTRGQLRAYYYHFAPVAERMHSDREYRAEVRTALVDRLVRHGAYELGMAYQRPSREDSRVATAFLHRLAVLGEAMPPVQRPDGSVI